MAYTKDEIAKAVFQKATGRASDVDLLQIDDNAVQVFNTQYLYNTFGTNLRW